MSYIYLKTTDDFLKDVLVDAVIQAKKRFWCVAPFVTKDGLSLIRDKMKPRVDYRLITRLDTGDMFFGSLDLNIIIKFIQNKGKVRFHNECLHSKLWISDDRVFIGSANLTGNALKENNELMVMANNEQFSEECRPIEWFENLWEAGLEKTIEELEEISQEAQSNKNSFEEIKRQMPKFVDYGKPPVFIQDKQFSSTKNKFNFADADILFQKVVDDIAKRNGINFVDINATGNKTSYKMRGKAPNVLSLMNDNAKIAFNLSSPNDVIFKDVTLNNIKYHGKWYAAVKLNSADDVENYADLIEAYLKKHKDTINGRTGMKRG